MRKLIFISVCILLLVKHAGAQEQPTIKQQADKLYERYEYFKSLTLYLKLAKNNKPNAKLAERIADCYKNINHYEDAEQWYAKATADVKVSRVTHYHYAEVLLREQKFDLAKEQYKIYFANDADSLRLKLSNCDSAAAWMGQRSTYKVKNDTTLNTEYSDWGLSLEGKTAVAFTSDRKTEGSVVDERTGNSWFKLYEMPANTRALKELSLSNMDDDYSYHIGPVAFNADGDTAYITVATGLPKKKLPIDKQGGNTKQRLYSRRLQLLMASKKNGQWVVFGGFPYNNVQKYSVGNAALSVNGRLIYFTSDMPGGLGKTDIWYCEKKTDGTWAQPVNCGNIINTKDDEDFPTIGGDGYLYYSSKGLVGMGGFDIYKADGEKATWSIPKNLKYPANSTSDDFYLVTLDGLTGYLSSNREGGKGSDDIYGFVRNPNDTVPPNLVTRRDTMGKTPVGPAKAKQDIILTTIYYDLDKSNIRPDAAAELDKLTVILKQRPELKIELSSYTDSRASGKYNLALSQRRAKAAVAYLVAKGIAETRLMARFYGETNLVNQCADNVKCTEEEHQLNRRTEFKVIGD